MSFWGNNKSNYKYALVLMFPLVIFAELRENLRSLLSDSQQHIRLAWCQSLKGGNRHLFVYDTETDTIRQLTFNSMFNNANKVRINWVSFSWDGSRIIFYDRASLTVYCINYNGTGLRAFAYGYRSSETWKSPYDGTDWVIAAIEGENTLGPVYRINVDSGERILLWDRTAVGNFKFENWMGLSPHGDRLVGNFPWPIKGIVNVISRSLDDAVVLPNGCGSGMARDGSNDVLHIVDHSIVTISNSRGDVIVNRPINQVFINGQGAQTKKWGYDVIRWSNDRDIVIIGINADSWPEMKGFAVGSFSKAAMFRSCTSGLNMCAHVYYPNDMNNIAPRIAHCRKLNVQKGKFFSTSVYIYGIPEPQVKVNGLVEGLQFVPDSSSPVIWYLKGTVERKDIYNIRISAVNTAGQDTINITLNVTDNNVPLKVNAGKDREVLISSPEIRLAGSIENADEISTYFVRWTLIDGQRQNLEIQSPTTLISGLNITAEGKYTFQLEAKNEEFTSRDTVIIDVRSAVPFEIISPKVGDTVHIGDTLEIEWQLEPPEAVVIQISTDNGKSWDNIGPASVGGKNIRHSYRWFVEELQYSSNKCLIGVYPYGNPNEKIVMKGPFIIIAPAAERNTKFNGSSKKLINNIYHSNNRGFRIVSATTYQAIVDVYSINGNRIKSIGPDNGSLPFYYLPSGISIVTIKDCHSFNVEKHKNFIIK